MEFKLAGNDSCGRWITLPGLLVNGTMYQTTSCLLMIITIMESLGQLSNLSSGKDKDEVNTMPQREYLMATRSN